MEGHSPFEKMGALLPSSHQGYVGHTTGQNAIGGTIVDSRINVLAVGKGTHKVNATHAQASKEGLLLMGKSPVKIPQLLQALRLYPDRRAASVLEQGFTTGFKVNYNGPRQEYQCHNLPSVNRNQRVARQKIRKEVEAGRVAGPFQKTPLKNLRCSPLGLVEKAQKGKFRLIHHLSFPQGDSVNTYICDELAKVSYTTFDKALEHVVLMGSEAQIAKADLKDAFRMLPIRPQDFDLLGFQFEGEYYFDKALPMGLKISCHYFEMFSTFLNWLINNLMSQQLCVHYLDDWLFFSPKQARGEVSRCGEVLSKFLAMCRWLGIPVAEEKTVCPCTCLVFLGLQIDTVKQEVRVPGDKLLACRAKLLAIQRKTTVSLREVQSLLGYLNFLARGVQGGRTFLQRLINLTRGVVADAKTIRLDLESQADIAMWLMFLENFNGTALILPREWLHSTVIHLYTDAAKTVGFGAFFKGSWLNGTWEDIAVSPMNSIAYLEFVPVLLAMLVWGPELANKRIMLHSDNKAVVAILNRQSSKCPHIMKLVRRLTLTCLSHNILLKGEYIEGYLNTIADKISRFEMHSFFQEVPSAQRVPAPYTQFLPLTLMRRCQDY